MEENKSLLKKLYKVFPFKKEIFNLLKLVWKPKESIYRHLHFTGVFRVSIDKEHSFKIKHYGYQLENEIFWCGLAGGWEKNSVKIWTQLCAQASSVVDIGANTGIYSLIAKAVNPNAKVYAFEPVKRVFKKMEENVVLNNFDIFLYEKGVSDKNGKAKIYDPGTDHVYSVTVNKNLASAEIGVTETEIDIVTLDTFIEENKIGHVDLLKIDVETHEPEVLKGFRKYLALFKPTMLVEVLNEEVAHEVSQAVAGLNYLYFNIDEVGSIRRVDKITKSDYYNFLLCNESTAAQLNLL